MAKRILRLVLIVPLIFLASAPGCRPRSTADTERISQPAKLVAAEQLRDTDVLPYLDGPIVPGRNYLYCATFQLAWNQSQEKVFREPIHLAGSPKMAEYLLRGDKLSESILPPNSYLLRAGLVKDGVVAEIREEMERRFPHATFQVPEPQKPVWAVVFAYLQRSLAFREAFDRLEKPLVFHAKNGPVKLASFGVRNLDVNSPRHALFLVHQVTPLVYASDDDFVLRLNTTSTEDEIVLAKVKPRATLAATLAAVRERIQRREGLHEWGPDSLMGEESLVVPIIELNVRREYTELERRLLTNPKWSTTYLAVAEQGIRFRLDEKGARLESDAAELPASATMAKPSQYIFDKPFLVYLKRKSCDEPYLAIWIETPELLKELGK
jgi:hypothetical protein